MKHSTQHKSGDQHISLKQIKQGKTYQPQETI